MREKPRGAIATLSLVGPSLSRPGGYRPFGGNIFFAWFSIERAVRIEVRTRSSRFLSRARRNLRLAYNGDVTVLARKIKIATARAYLSKADEETVGLIEFFSFFLLYVYSDSFSPKATDVLQPRLTPSRARGVGLREIINLGI